MRMILQIIISNGILDLVTGILAKISLGTGIWYPPSQPSLFFQQLSYLRANVGKYRESQISSKNSNFG